MHIYLVFYENLDKNLHECKIHCTINYIKKLAGVRSHKLIDVQTKLIDKMALFLLCKCCLKK